MKTKLEITAKHKLEEIVSDPSNNDANDSIAGGDITVPGISEGDENEKMNGNTSPLGGKYTLRPNPTPNYTDEYRY